MEKGETKCEGNAGDGCAEGAMKADAPIILDPPVSVGGDRFLGAEGTESDGDRDLLHFPAKKKKIGVGMEGGRSESE